MGYLYPIHEKEYSKNEKRWMVLNYMMGILLSKCQILYCTKLNYKNGEQYTCIRFYDIRFLI